MCVCAPMHVHTFAMAYMWKTEELSNWFSPPTTVGPGDQMQTCLPTKPSHQPERVPYIQRDKGLEKYLLLPQKTWFPVQRPRGSS